MYSRYGHVNQVFVKVGDKVKLGQKIATNGTGNGQWLAHLHRDHPRVIPGGNYMFYNIGWTLTRTKDIFADPKGYPKALGKEYSHPGYDYLDIAQYSTGKCFHPGLDENGQGSGNADYDDPIYCVAEGTVVFVANDGKAKNGGWGKLIVIREEALEPVVKINNEDMKVTKKLGDLYLNLTGKSAGDNLNETEQDKLADTATAVMAELRGRITDYIGELNTVNSKISEQSDKIKNQSEQITLLESKLAKEKEAHNQTQQVLAGGSSMSELLKSLWAIIIKK